MRWVDYRPPFEPIYSSVIAYTKGDKREWVKSEPQERILSLLKIISIEIVWGSTLFEPELRNVLVCYSTLVESVIAIFFSHWQALKSHPTWNWLVFLCITVCMKLTPCSIWVSLFVCVFVIKGSVIGLSVLLILKCYHVTVPFIRSLHLSTQDRVIVYP